MSNSNDSLKNIIGVALGVCLVCSILVAAAAVLLKPRQVANQKLERQKNILIAGALIKEKQKVDAKKVFSIFSEKIQPALIELKTGDLLPKEKMTGKLDPENFNIKKIYLDPEYGRDVPPDQYTAGIKRVPTHMIIYFVKEGDNISRVIFPVYGSGLWSTLYGFLALDRELKTVEGFTIYEHGETPGLGGEVDNPKWKALWKGKIAFNDAGVLQLEVLKGTAAPGSTMEIDGLSGATLTTRGVDDMIAFWFGPKKKEPGKGRGYYRPFMEKFKEKQQQGGQQ
jgi:Na+-transporting NADH:ubiquinone oxidoreductase subunit C